ncbi:hypothetical protein JCM10599A_66690 [Paraburkholderia kururiensis]
MNDVRLVKAGFVSIRHGSPGAVSRLNRPPCGIVRLPEDIDGGRTRDDRIDLARAAAHRGIDAAHGLAGYKPEGGNARVAHCVADAHAVAGERAAGNEGRFVGGQRIRADIGRGRLVAAGIGA